MPLSKLSILHFYSWLWFMIYEWLINYNSFPMSHLKTVRTWFVWWFEMHVNFLHDERFASSLPSPKRFPPNFFTLTPKISHPWPQKLNFSPRISFLTQNYSLEGCFNVGNSEHVKDVEAKIIVQVPDGKYKSLRHLCDFLWFLRLVIGCLRLYRGSQKYQLVPVKDRPAIISLSKLMKKP